MQPTRAQVGQFERKACLFFPSLQYLGDNSLPRQVLVALPWQDGLPANTPWIPLDVIEGASA